MFPYKSLIVFLVVIGISWLAQETAATAYRRIRSSLDNQTRQAIIELARQVIYLASNGGGLNSNRKRNGGTADTFYNIPDLEDIGKK